MKAPLITGYDSPYEDDYTFLIYGAYSSDTSIESEAALYTFSISYDTTNIAPKLITETKFIIAEKT